LELSLACTFRIAADGTRLGLPEVGLGILPGGGGTQRLPRLIGPERALSLLLTGRTITAMEACDLGIVGRVVPPGRALDEALTLADEIASAAPLAVRAILAAVVSGADRPLDDAIAETENALRTLLDSRDGAEGMTAFAERRKPAFTGE
jgi:enoyl-CoA hydratase/carnithine racemase